MDSLATLSTAEVATRLNTTRPTVVSLIEKGLLRATEAKRGSRHCWLVDPDSVTEFLATYGTYPKGGKKAASQARTDLSKELSIVKTRIATLESELGSRVAQSGPALLRENEGLRAQVLNLREVLARTRSVAELQKQADIERAIAVDHLAAAVKAGERVDAIRRLAISELEEGLATFSGHANLGDVF